MPIPNQRPAARGKPSGIRTKRDARQQPPRDQPPCTRRSNQVIDRHRPSESDPLQVLDRLIRLHNAQHTALEKTVSHKTRQERADFLHRFFRDLKLKAGFKTVPDPRNLGDRHIRAMVAIWQLEQLAPATIQTYLSFLRGLALWLGKPGFIRKPAHYGLAREEYQRHEYAQRDKSWTAAGIDIDALIDKVCQYDRFVGAALRLIRAMGLRRKESVMFRPHRNVVPFEATGLPPDRREADQYVLIREGAKGGRPRYVPINTTQRVMALEFAQAVAQGDDAHLGDPRHSLQRNLRRFDYVMARFKITEGGLGATAHGLRHEAMIDHYISKSGGEAPPIRTGSRLVPSELDQAVRQSAAELAGHHRVRASGAYLGPPSRRPCGPLDGDHDRDGSPAGEDRSNANVGA